jgi:L-aminopeptidase/D-esterase-like protein
VSRFVVAMLLLALSTCPPITAASSSAPQRPRARDLGIPFDGAPGALNAITDVPGVEVGMVTLIRDAPRAGGGTAAVRTGVTAILPRGKRSGNPVFGAWFPLNGNGEMTGTHWLQESGFLEGPILITNTHSVGVVRDAVVRWQVEHKFLYQEYTYPIVAETFDGHLNDINGFHVTAEDAIRAIEGAAGGSVQEGNVGGGTGMVCYEFKCGTGTASRRLSDKDGGHVVGVLVQANHGARHQLQVAGVPVGGLIGENAPYTGGRNLDNERGSIIIVVATDAPLLPHQLRRLAVRASLGLARTGGRAGNGSGDIFIAFSTANAQAPARDRSLVEAQFVPNDRINPLFSAVILATEEAILNALVAGETMTGFDGHRVDAIPHDRLQAALRRHGRLAR